MKEIAEIKPSNDKLFSPCLSVYSGNGKGKTTAAFGLAVRAAGNGFKTFIGQFMKNYPYGEVAAMAELSDFIRVEQFGSPICIKWKEKPQIKDVNLAVDGLKKCEEVIRSGKYQIVILDEINVAIHFKLLSIEALFNVLDIAKGKTEIICTGRYAPQSLVDRADLVTWMQEIKHPFSLTNLPARDGIER